MTGLPKGLFLFAEREFEGKWGEIFHICKRANSLKTMKAPTVREILH